MNINKDMTWSNFKKTLQSTSIWLNAFTKPAIAQAIDIIQTRPRNHYEPLLLDTLLTEASEALDRCLSFRRDAYDLEIAAVKAAADYELFLRLADIDAKLETNALPMERLHNEASGYEESAKAFKSEQGFAKHDETLSKSAMADIKAAEERQRLLNERWDIRKKYEAEYHSRHITPGNAHNYQERMERIVTLLADDLQESYEKLIAVHMGLRAVYAKDIPLPELQGEKALDDLVIWAREVIRYIDLERQQEVSYELVIPLTQKWGTSEGPILSHDALQECIQKPGPKKVISITLDKAFFSHERVRLFGVGLAFGSNPVSASYGGMEQLGYYRLFATIHTPKQPIISKQGSYYRRPPIVLGNVGVHAHPVQVAMQFGPECRNINPLGEWKIELNRFAVWSNHHDTDIETESEGTLIRDLKLHLRVAAKPQSEID